MRSICRVLWHATSARWRVWFRNAASKLWKYQTHRRKCMYVCVCLCVCSPDGVLLVDPEYLKDRKGKNKTCGYAVSRWSTVTVCHIWWLNYPLTIYLIDVFLHPQCLCLLLAHFITVGRTWMCWAFPSGRTCTSAPSRSSLLCRRKRSLLPGCRRGCWRSWVSMPTPSTSL